MWLIIILIVVLFFVIKKPNKSAIMKGKRGISLVIGWFNIIMGGMLVLGSAGEVGMISVLVIGIIMFVGGIVLLVKASKIKKSVVKYKRYIDMVVNQKIRSIDNVAAAMGLSYEEAVKDLQKMINIDYLKDGYIHHGNREISLKQHTPMPAMYAQVPAVEQVPLQTVALRCSGCGANNVVIVGKVSECEYCGVPINA